MYELDQAAQNDPEWIVWSQPEHIAAEVDRLFTETLPRVPADWKKPSGEGVGSMPEGVDRYSEEMTLHWIIYVFDYFFPDEDALYEPELAEVENQFICYIGDYFVRHCDGRWINEPSSSVRYPFGPSIGYDWTRTIDNPEDLLYMAVCDGDFIRVTSEWYSRTIDHAEAFDLPHEGRELRQKYGNRG